MIIITVFVTNVTQTARLISSIDVAMSSGTSEDLFIFVTIIFVVARFTHVVEIGSARLAIVMETTIPLLTSSAYLARRKFFLKRN